MHKMMPMPTRFMLIHFEIQRKKDFTESLVEKHLAIPKSGIFKKSIIFQRWTKKP